MTYFLVMGGLVLSVCFTAGWGLMRGFGWLTDRLRSGKGTKKQRARKASTRKPPAKPSATKARPKSTKVAKPQEPCWLTRCLARGRSAVPLSLLALLLYGFTRLAEYGMSARPHDTPGVYHELVSALGWIAAGLLAMALISLLASWRCHHLAKQ